MFYTFRQNNSGGYYSGPQYIIIEAADAEEANERSQSTQIYFDGASNDGPDCPCCGDRWYRAYSNDKGTDQPEIYGYNQFQDDEWVQTDANDEDMDLEIHYLNDATVYFKRA